MPIPHDTDDLPLSRSQGAVAGWAMGTAGAGLAVVAWLNRDHPTEAVIAGVAGVLLVTYSLIPNLELRGCDVDVNALIDALEKPCDACGGEPSQSCQVCGGRGKVPSEAGEKLLQFLAWQSWHTAPDVGPPRDRDSR